MDGFQQDFFEGVTVAVSHAEEVELLTTGMAKVVGPDANQPWVMRMGMGDSGMGKSGMGEPTTTMPGMGDSGSDSGGMSEMMGLMLVLEPGGTATVSFTVPDKPGRWQFGCFEQSGQHFLNGMKGWVTVRP